MLTVNRDRLDLLRAVHAGQVYRSMKGCDLRMVRRGQNRRVDRALRLCREAGWVELAEDGRMYRLTGVGADVAAAGGEGGGAR